MDSLVYKHPLLWCPDCLDMTPHRIQPFGRPICIACEAKREQAGKPEHVQKADKPEKFC